MENNLEKLEAILAKSNLVATAGEFIPKSQMKTEHSQDQYDSVHAAQDEGQYVKKNESVGSNYYENHNGFKNFDKGYSYNDCTNEPTSSKGNSHQNFNRTSNQEHINNHRKNNSYYSRNREPKFTKGNQSKFNNSDKWRKVDKEFVKSDAGLRNRAAEKVTLVNPLHDFGTCENFLANEANVQDENHYSERPRQKQRNYDGPNSNYYKSRDSTYYKSQHWNNSQSDNASWSRRKRNDGQQYEEYQPYYSGARNRNRQVSEEYNFYRNNEYDADRKKSSSGFNRNKVKSRYQAKNAEPNQASDSRVEYPSPEREVEEEKKDKLTKTSQRERLIDLLTRGVLECLVCCEQVQQNNPTWSCSNCYHVLHLKCIIKWAKSSKDDFGWRCPACQNITNDVPYVYFCFCGKVRDPEWNRSDCPHSCGDVCGKTRRTECTHKCMLLCHPGPCPQCSAMITKTCGCGKTSKMIQCFASQIVICDNVCGKSLNCKLHQCQLICHMGDCEECKEIINQGKII